MLKESEYSVIVNSQRLKITYSSSDCFPPGRGALAMASEAAEAVMWESWGVDKMRILEPGIGTGISLLAISKLLGNTCYVEMIGFDRSGIAVETARQNLKQITNHDHRTRVFKGDWNKEASWQKAGGNFDIILFNPPFLGAGHPAVEGHEEAPRLSTHTEDGLGLECYQVVLPRLVQALKKNGSSIMIVRMPPVEEPNSDVIYEYIKGFKDKYNLHGIRQFEVVDLERIIHFETLWF
jgi:methylase of polypeptide subunit release factors